MNDYRTMISMKYSTGYTFKDKIRLFVLLQEKERRLLVVKNHIVGWW